MPPPPAPQWFDCAWPIEILTSRFATSLWSQTGVPREDTPTYVYASALRGSFWKNGMPSRSMRARLSRPSFCSMSDSDIGNTFPFAQTTQASVMPAASIASSTAGRSFDDGVGRNWLSMITATLPAPESSSEKRGPETGLLERLTCGLGRVGDGVRLVGVDGGEQVRVPGCRARASPG